MRSGKAMVQLQTIGLTQNVAPPPVNADTPTTYLLVQKAPAKKHSCCCLSVFTRANAFD